MPDSLKTTSQVKLFIGSTEGRDCVEHKVNGWLASSPSISVRDIQTTVTAAGQAVITLWFDGDASE